MLRELALHGTIRAAAESLSFSPSAVSQQLSTLEREAGVALLERRGRSVRLTAAGLALAERTESILAGLAEAEAEAKAIAGSAQPGVHVASFPSAAATVVADALAESEGLEVTILEADPKLGLARLRAGEVDVAIVWEYDFVPIQASAAVELVPLLDDPVQVVLPRRHPAAVRATVDLAELAAETNDHRTLHRLIASGVGLALVPVLSQLDLPPALVARPIWPNPLKRRIHAAARLGRRPEPVLRLLDLLEASAAAWAERIAETDAAPRREGLALAK